MYVIAKRIAGIKSEVLLRAPDETGAIVLAEFDSLVPFNMISTRHLNSDVPLI